MFKIKADPTFEAAITIVGQGREQKLNVVFRHKKRSEYLALLERLKNDEASSADVILEVVDSWDADMPLTAASIAELQDEQPGVDWAIVQTYGEALAVARKGN